MLKHFAEGAFSSRHLNLLNIHLGIVNFGQVLRLGINVVFFHQIGLSLPATLAAMASFFVVRALTRTPLITLTMRYGTKPALIIGQILLAAAFGLYSQVTEAGPLLWFAILVMAAGEALYWHAVHTVFATLAEAGKFGRQLGARAIFMSVGGTLAPIASGFVAGAAGWYWLYALSAVSMALSVIPLFFMPEPCPPRMPEWKKGLHISKSGFHLFAGIGGLSAISNMVWPLIIFLEMGTLQKFGALLTATMLLSFFLSIYVGRRIDLGKGRNVVIYGAAMYAAALMAQALFGHTATSILLLSGLMSLANSCFTQPYNAALYKWAQETHDPLWFHFWSEAGYDTGCLVVLFTAAAALLVIPDLNLRWAMVLALPAIAWCYLVYRSDGKSRSRREAATAGQLDIQS